MVSTVALAQSNGATFIAGSSGCAQFAVPAFGLQSANARFNPCNNDRLAADRLRAASVPQYGPFSLAGHVSFDDATPDTIADLVSLTPFPNTKPTGDADHNDPTAAAATAIDHAAIDKVEANLPEDATATPIDGEDEITHQRDYCTALQTARARLVAQLRVRVQQLYKERQRKRGLLKKRMQMAAKRPHTVNSATKAAAKRKAAGLVPSSLSLDDSTTTDGKTTTGRADLPWHSGSFTSSLPTNVEPSICASPVSSEEELLENRPLGPRDAAAVGAACAMRAATIVVPVPKTEAYGYRT